METSKTLSIGIYLSDTQGLTPEMAQELFRLAVYGDYHFQVLDDLILYKAMRVDSRAAARLAQRAKEAGLSIAHYTAACINYLLEGGLYDG